MTAMEAFGRAIVVSLGAMGLVVFLLFYKNFEKESLLALPLKDMEKYLEI